MNVLLTGATGFIGREIVSELSKNSINIVGVTGSKSKVASFDLKPAVEILSADVTDDKNFSELRKLENIDAVIHSAGLAHQFGDTKKEEFDAVNVEGTKNIANLAVFLKAKHLILISSTAVYGSSPANKIDSTNIGNIKENIEATNEDAPANPQTLYARSKLEAENVCLKICAENNLPLTIFRLAPVIGEANVGNVARLIETVDRGRFVWVGKGENYKSLIYKTDVARACVEILRKKTGGAEIFNLAAQPLKMQDFVNEIARSLDKKLFKFAVPPEIPRAIFSLNSKFVKNRKLEKISDTIEKWLADDVYSAEKIKAKYGFEPQTCIFEAVGRQIEWHRANGKNKN